MNLTILSESLPKRCEVCHQSDRFDPATNFCGRCTTVEIPQKQTAVPVSVLVPRFCLLSEMTPDEIEELPTVAQLSFALSLLHLLLFYLNYCLRVMPLHHKQDLFRFRLLGELELILLLSFFGAWLLGLFCFRTAWNLFPQYKESWIFLFSGLICFWPTIHMIFIFISSGVGLLGSSDDICCC